MVVVDSEEVAGGGKGGRLAGARLSPGRYYSPAAQSWYAIYAAVALHLPTVHPLQRRRGLTPGQLASRGLPQLDQLASQPRKSLCSCCTPAGPAAPASHLLLATTTMVDLASAKTVVKDLVHWENPVGSASTLGFVLAVLVSICYYSFISVVAYISLTLLVIVLGIKIYSFAMVFLKKVKNSHFHSSHQPESREVV